MWSAPSRPNSNARKELTGDRGAAGASRPDRDPGAARAGVLLLVVLALAPPAAAQVALGGVMRFATADVAFHGGFGGVAVDVWGVVEPYGYVSQDAGVWAIQAGIAAPIVRRETVRVSGNGNQKRDLCGHLKRDPPGEVRRGESEPAAPRESSSTTGFRQYVNPCPPW